MIDVEEGGNSQGIVSRLRQTVADSAATLGAFLGGFTAEVAESYQKPASRVILSSLLLGVVGTVISGDLSTATRVGVISSVGTEVVLSVIGHKRSKE